MGNFDEAERLKQLIKDNRLSEAYNHYKSILDRLTGGPKPTPLPSELLAAAVAVIKELSLSGNFKASEELLRKTLDRVATKDDHYFLDLSDEFVGQAEFNPLQKFENSGRHDRFFDQALSIRKSLIGADPTSAELIIESILANLQKARQSANGGLAAEAAGRLARCRDLMADLESLMTHLSKPPSLLAARVATLRGFFAQSAGQRDSAKKAFEEALSHFGKLANKESIERSEVFEMFMEQGKHLATSPEQKKIFDEIKNSKISPRRQQTMHKIKAFPTTDNIAEVIERAKSQPGKTFFLTSLGFLGSQSLKIAVMFKAGESKPLVSIASARSQTAKEEEITFGSDDPNEILRQIKELWKQLRAVPAAAGSAELAALAVAPGGLGFGNRDDQSEDGWMSIPGTEDRMNVGPNARTKFPKPTAPGNKARSIDSDLGGKPMGYNTLAGPGGPGESRPGGSDPRLKTSQSVSGSMPQATSNRFSGSGSMPSLGNSASSSYSQTRALNDSGAGSGSKNPGSSSGELAPLNPADLHPAVRDSFAQAAPSTEAESGVFSKRRPDDDHRSTLIFEGNLKTMPSLGLLQTISLNANTGVLEVTGKSGPLSVYFDGGKPVHALSMKSDGIDVLYEFILQEEGWFRFKPDKKPPVVSIKVRLDSFLLEAAQLFDETKYLKSLGLTMYSGLIAKEFFSDRSDLEAYMAARNSDLEEASWDFYLALLENPIVSDAVEFAELKYKDWLHALYRLVQVGLVTISNAGMDDEDLSHRLINRWSYNKRGVEEFTANLCDSRTGFLRFEFLIWLLEREFERARTQMWPLSIIILEFRKRGVGFSQMSVEDKELVHATLAQIAETKRSIDWLAHFEDDQFALLLPGLDTNLATMFARNFVEICSRTLGKLKEGHSDWEYSFGLSTVPADTFEWQKMVGYALEAQRKARLTRSGLQTHADTKEKPPA